MARVPCGLRTFGWNNVLTEPSLFRRTILIITGPPTKGYSDMMGHTTYHTFQPIRLKGLTSTEESTKVWGDTQKTSKNVVYFSALEG